MILSPTGHLVWFDPIPAMSGVNAMNFRVQTLFGQPVLTWWQGTEVYGDGYGRGLILDRHYRPVATVRAGNGLQMDLHEFLLSSGGDAYITAISPLLLPGWSIPVLDDVIQEIDVRTGLVLYEWHALDHLALSDSYTSPTVGSPLFDPFHINSIDIDHGGDLIVSMRNTSAVYRIDHRTGAVLWRLGGKRSSFRFGAGADSAYQHDVSVQPGGTLSIFDDGGGAPETTRSRPFSRGITVALNTRTMTATLIHEYDHYPALGTNWEGSLQLLYGGEAFVGWGGPPYFSEYNIWGQQDFDAHFTFATGTYRAYRFLWSAEPDTRPSLAVVRRPGGSSNVYVSWTARPTSRGGSCSRPHPGPSIREQRPPHRL